MPYLEPSPPKNPQLCVSESAREMLEENHRMMFFKLFEQPLPLFDRHGFVWRDVTKKQLEALQCGSFSLVLVLLWRHLLAEGERCNAQWGSGCQFSTTGLGLKSFCFLGFLFKINTCFLSGFHTKSFKILLSSIDTRGVWRALYLYALYLYLSLNLTYWQLSQGLFPAA